MEQRYDEDNRGESTNMDDTGESMLLDVRSSGIGIMGVRVPVVCT